VTKPLADFVFSTNWLFESEELIMSEPGRRFAILRIEKKRDNPGLIVQLGRHNSRQMDVPNADPAAAPPTVFVGTGDARADIEDRLSDAGVLRRRSNAVLAVEVVMAASPEWWRRDEAGRADPEQIRAWQEASLAWLRREHGPNVVSAWLHTDEKSPHLHALVVPVDTAPSAKGKKTGPRLNARKWFSGREQLSAMQDRYAEAVEGLGLERGVKGSKARHQRVQRHYARLDELEATAVARDHDAARFRVEAIDAAVGELTAAQADREEAARSLQEARRAALQAQAEENPLRSSAPPRRPPSAAQRPSRQASRLSRPAISSTASTTSRAARPSAGAIARPASVGASESGWRSVPCGTGLAGRLRSCAKSAPGSSRRRASRPGRSSSRSARRLPPPPARSASAGGRRPSACACSVSRGASGRPPQRRRRAKSCGRAPAETEPAEPVTTRRLFDPRPCCD
jgi:hypothetical protein